MLKGCPKQRPKVTVVVKEGCDECGRTSATLGANRFLLLRRIINCILAGLLIFYHCTGLYDLCPGGAGNLEGLYDRTSAGAPQFHESPVGASPSLILGVERRT